MTVSNDLVSAPASVKSERALVALVARSLCGDQPNIIGIGDTQASANPRSGSDFLSPPSAGAWVWNGEQVGVVNASVQADYLDFTRRSGSARFDSYVNDLMQRSE